MHICLYAKNWMIQVYNSMEEAQKFFRGQIYYVEFYDMDSHVVKGTRPAVIVSNDVHNRFSGTLIVIPITTKVKDYPTHMNIETPNGVYGQILCENIMTVDKTQVGEYKDTLSEKQIEELDKTIALELQLGGKDKFDYMLQVKRVEEAKKAYERELAKLGMYESAKVELKPKRDVEDFIREYAVSTNKTETAKKFGFSSLQAASKYYAKNKDRVLG